MVSCGYSKRKTGQEMRLYVTRGQSGVLGITVKNYVSGNSRAGWATAGKRVPRPTQTAS